MNVISIGPVLLALLVAMSIASLPIFRYSRNWGTLPSGGLSAIVIGISALFLLRIQ